MFRLLVAGSRSLTNYSLVDLWCSKVKTPITELVSGKAIGADTLGEFWAIGQGIPIKEFPADWDRYGKRAGFIRNEDMARYCDAGLIFWDGESRGTKHMIDLLKKHGKKCYVVNITPSDCLEGLDEDAYETAMEYIHESGDENIYV